MNARANPLSQAERINTIDILRGLALFGILLMNIPTFSMPDYFSESFRNNPNTFSFWLYEFIYVFFEGKMRALFGMIFGAGVLLFTLKKKELGRPVHSLFYRRMFWLLLFGLAHAHLLLWNGDILYLYAVCGALVYLFRNVKPKYLVLGIPLVAILDFGSGTIMYQNIREKYIVYTEAVDAKKNNMVLSDNQTRALEEWRGIELTLIPSREDALENTRKMKSDYNTIASYQRMLSWEWETKYLIWSVWDSLALMLLGLALFKWGFLSGKWKNRDYKTVMWIGYGIGLPLVIYSQYDTFINYPNHEAVLQRMLEVPINWVGLIYPFQRILLVMAHVSAVILIYKSGIAQRLLKRFESVGQMAFSNYISHTIICTLFFYGYGLNYFAELDYYKIYIVVLAIWTFQLIISPVWLHNFNFGPLEWLWRSLTYWKIYPMKRRTPEINSTKQQNLTEDQPTP